jgi:hypothetical protein
VQVIDQVNRLPPTDAGEQEDTHASVG